MTTWWFKLPVVVLVYLTLSAQFASEVFAEAGTEDSIVAGVISKNVDGDTVHVCPGQSPDCSTDPEVTNHRLIIRMVGIDAPETHLPSPHGIVGQGKFGDDSARYLSSLVPFGARVILEDQGLDKYKRTLGRLYANKKDINLAMVRAGWAITYIICSGPACDEDFLERERVDEYVDACESARRQGRGIFNPNNPLKEMPFEFRLRMQGRTPDKYVGNISTTELFEPAKYKKVDLCQRIFFLTLADARHAGFDF